MKKTMINIDDKDSMYKNLYKNLSLTLNDRNSETKNYKNNPKVPKFSSCRGLSSTLLVVAPLFVGVFGCLWVLEV